jgi:hypothetical protein
MKKIPIITLVALFVTGCGEFAYKRGASAKDLEASKKICQNSGSSLSIEKCLEDNGWVVQKLDGIGLPDSELFATASVTTDNRQPSMPSATSSTNKETEQTNEAALPVNNLETYKITSWWKMGAGQNMLETDIKTCSDTLGKEHQPNRTTQTFTRGFALCMYQRSWRGLKEK